MILLKYLSWTRFTQSQFMGIPIFHVWFHDPQGAHLLIFGYKVSLCIGDTNCKVIYTDVETLCFYSFPRKV